MLARIEQALKKKREEIRLETNERTQPSQPQAPEPRIVTHDHVGLELVMGKPFAIDADRHGNPVYAKDPTGRLVYWSGDMRWFGTQEEIEQARKEAVSRGAIHAEE